MIGASLYIVGCTAANRLRRWLERLREPRYLVGAAAVGVYAYFVFVARARRGGGEMPPDFMTSIQPAGTVLVALWMLVMAAAGWIVPFESGLLDFSPAEVELLFPAPVTRRALLVYRLLRSQIGLALAGIIPALVVPFGSGADRLRIAIAIWLMATTGKLYFTGVSLTRNRGWRRAWQAPALTAAIVAIVGAAVAGAVVGQPFTGVEALFDRMADALRSGPARAALLPLTALAKPLFTASAREFLTAFASAGVVLAVTFAWVIRADEALLDVSEHAAERSDRPAGGRMGRARAAASAWALPSTGRPEMVFAWKAATQTLRVSDRQTIVRLVAIVASVAALALAMSRSAGVAAALGFLGAGGCAYVVLMAPQILRIDLRQDLQKLEWLKTWPVRPAEVVRGELLWPAVLLTGLAWTLLALGFVMSSAAFGSMRLGLRLSIASGAAILVPALVFAQLTVHNAAALVFPGWIALGRQRARGFDAIGHRLITVGATWLTMIVGLLPGILAGGIVWFALARLIGAAAIVPGAAAAAIVVLVEVALATEALGPLFERIDITSVEHGA